MSPTFAFDSKSQRFRFTSGNRNGQYVSQDKVKDIVDREYIRSQKDVLKDLGDRLISGYFELADWEIEVTQTIKTLHINAYTLGKGGLERLTQRDYGTVGERIKREYVYLRNFTNEVAKGEMSIAQFQNRLSMYADSAFGTYQKARMISHQSDGFEWYRNIRNVSESCNECIDISAKGWDRVGAYPNIGNRACKGNDRCNWEFAKGDRPTETNRFLLDFYAGWLNGILLEKKDPKKMSRVAQLEKDLALAKAAELDSVLPADRPPQPYTPTPVPPEDEPTADPEPPEEEPTGYEDPEEEDPEEEGNEELGMTPSAEQLKKINLWIPANAASLTARDVITVPIVASNNLLQWTNECWHPNSIKAMAKTMPGRIFMINHGDDKGGMWGLSWDSVRTHKGKIYDARHMVYYTAPDELLDCAGNGEVNRQIVATFGYHVLEIDVFLDRDCEVAEEIRYGTHLDVSTGTVGMVRYLCPMCSDFNGGEEIEFTDDDCPHYPPTNGIMNMLRRGELDPEQEIMVAPYIVQDGVDYSVETSSVCTGNLPSARVVSRRDILEGIY